jgi:hypothetical protein
MTRLFAISRLFATTLWAVAILSGCGGSGGGISGTGITTDSNDVVVGTIEGFGSVIVNQRRLATGSADIIVNGTPSTQTDLRIGMQVRINADLDSLTATRIDYVPLVVGPVGSVSPISNTLDILGHTVRTTTETRYDGVAEESIVPGTVLEVSGFVNASQQIVATFVRPVSAADRYQLLADVRARRQGFDISTDLSDFEFTMAQLELELQILAELEELSEFATRRAVITVPADDTALSPSLAFLLPTNNFIPGARADVLQAVTVNEGDGRFRTEGFAVTVTAETTILFGSGVSADLQDIQPNRIVRVRGTIPNSAAIPTSETGSDNHATILAEEITIF